jgi:hypothetical protein
LLRSRAGVVAQRSCWHRMYHGLPRRCGSSSGWLVANVPAQRWFPAQGCPGLTSSDEVVGAKRVSYGGRPCAPARRRAGPYWFTYTAIVSNDPLSS